jgi:ATP-binding cassette subfamily C protein
LDIISDKNDISLLLQLATILVLAQIISLVVGYLGSILTTKLVAKASFRLNMVLTERVISLSNNYWRDISPSYLSQRINNDSNSVISFSFSSVSDTITNIVTFLFIIFTSTILDASILYIFPLATILYTIAYSVLRKKVFAKSLTLQEAGNMLFSLLTNSLSKRKFIITHSIYDYFRNRLQITFSEFLKKKLDFQKVQYSFSSVDAIISSMANSTLLIVCGYAVINGDMTLGSLTVILSFFRISLNIVRFFFNIGKSFQESSVSYLRIREVLDAPNPISGTVQLTNIESIKVKGLSFCYDMPLIRNLNCTFIVGKIYIIVGRNGAGKSTLAELLLGLKNTQYQGSILINDIDIEHLNLQDFRRKHVCTTEQNVELVDDTIESNICLLANRQVKSEEYNFLIQNFYLEKDCNDSHLSFTKKLDDNNTNVSIGEKQKIAIIRCLIKDADIMIFDEPTSALDNVSVHAFIGLVKAVSKTKIIIIITHDDRLTCIADSVVEL